MSHTLIEQLESKRFLSATLKDNILTVTGTDAADKISFWFGEQHPNRLIVTIGKQEFSFERSDIRLMRVNGEGGDDRISPINVSGQVNIKLSMNGGPGDDLLVGGSANDTLVGGPGNDDLSGGDGLDTVDYHANHTTFLTASKGVAHGVIASIDGIANDQDADGVDNIRIDVEAVIGTSFRDVITGDGSDNTLVGGGGPDQIFGSDGKDLIEGGDGNNNLVGGSGADTIIGGAGNSTLEGDSGNDSLGGGSGDELLSGGTGNDRYNGGAGFDTADFVGDKHSFRLTFDGRFNDGPAGDSDDFIEIDQVLANSNSDRVDASGLGHGIHFSTTGSDAVITGTEFADHLEMEGGTMNGLGGNDLLDGGFGGTVVKSVIDGGAGNDTIRTAEGNDDLTGGRGNDSITAGDGNDSVNGGPGRDTIRGSVGDDQLRGDGNTDHIYGDQGNDTVIGEGKKDYLFGGDDSDTFLVAEHDAGFVQDFVQGTDRVVQPPDVGP